MKKFLSIVLIVLFSFSLVACDGSEGSNEDSVVIPEDLTTYETVEQFLEEFSIPNSDELRQNIFLPTFLQKASSSDSIIWETTNANVLSNKGFVTRGTEDIEVTLAATITFGTTKHREYFTCTVLANPSTDQLKIEEAAEHFVLLENNYVDQDIMVIPRVTSFSGGYITWETSNSNIIDLDGNVSRTNKEQKVTLTGTFTLGTASYKKTYEVTVGTTTDDSPELVTTSLSNIKRIISVENVEGIYAAVASSEGLKPGDAVVLEDGVYNAVDITINNSGTEKNPIYFMARNPGKVKFTGVTNIEVFADHVVVANLLFVDGSPKLDTGLINFEGNHLRFTNNEIFQFDDLVNLTDYKWVSLTGQYHEIDRNVFDGKVTGGSLLTIWRESLDAQYHHIHKNEFKNYQSNKGGNGFETIRIGTSDFSQSDSYVLLEDNYFEDINSEIEIVSIKAGRTIARNNTFVRCDGLLVSRHGKNNLLTGNSFLAEFVFTPNEGSGGIRLYDGGHTVTNNYIHQVNSNSDSRGGIVVHCGVQEIGTTTTMNLQWTPYNILIANNTISDSIGALVFDGKYPFAAKDIHFENNVVQHASDASHIARVDRTVSEGEVTFNEYNYFFGTTTTSSFSLFTGSAVINTNRTAAESQFNEIDGVRYFPNVGDVKVGVIDVTIVSVDTVGTSFENQR